MEIGPSQLTEKGENEEEKTRVMHGRGKEDPRGEKSRMIPSFDCGEGRVGEWSSGK